MKKIITPLALAAAILAGVPSASAQALDLCKEMGLFAEAIMQQRQGGAVMSDLMTSIEATEGVDQIYKEMGRAVIMDAFNQPQYGSAEYQAQAARDFRNSVELVCYQSQ